VVVNAVRENLETADTAENPLPTSDRELIEHYVEHVNLIEAPLER
jgi:hypothetical protein